MVQTRVYPDSVIALVQQIRSLSGHSIVLDGFYVANRSGRILVGRSPRELFYNEVQQMLREKGLFGLTASEVEATDPLLAWRMRNRYSPIRKRPLGFVGAYGIWVYVYVWPYEIRDIMTTIESIDISELWYLW